MFYLFDFAKVVNFLPFTKYFCNYFAFIIIFSFYLDYIGARLHLCGPPRHRSGIHSSHRRATAHTTATPSPRLACPSAYMQPPPRRARTRLLSAAALSLLNRSFKVELTSAIALIINYLGVPFRICFTKQERVKKLITSEIQRINHLKNNNLQENIIYLEFSYKTRKTTKVLLNSIIFKKNTII